MNKLNAFSQEVRERAVQAVPEQRRVFSLQPIATHYQKTRLVGVDELADVPASAWAIWVQRINTGCSRPKGYSCAGF